MFDITSFVREKIFRRPKLVQTVAWEELSEKQTTKLGYFLLYLMFWAILWSAQWTLSIIGHLVDRPQNVPYCVENMIETFEKDYSRDYYKYDCKLISENPEFNLKTEFDNLLPAYTQILSYRKEISEYNSKIRRIDYNYDRNREEYNTALIEKIAREKLWLYDSKQITNTISDDRKKILDYQNSINILKWKISDLKTRYNFQLKEFKIKLEQAKSDYRIAYLWYKFFIALLSFGFIIIVFSILYNIYVKQKIKNSPHTIIFSIATFAYGLVFLQIAFMFIWDIIPHRFLEYLGKLFDIFTPLLYIVQFLWPILIIAVFGFLVYKIQKRLYAPENVLKRFIKEKKCPNCWNSVDFTKPFCPLCSHEIQTKCKKCWNLNVKWMPFCSSCGEKQ